MPLPYFAFKDEELFQAVNVVLPCWIMLALQPNSKMTHTLCLLSTLALCALYAGLTIPMLTEAGGMDFKSFMTLQGVAKLMSTYRVVLPCWVHFSVADLWVGKWIADDAHKRRINRLIMVPILAAGMLLGPIGLGAYLLIRPFVGARQKRD